MPVIPAAENYACCEVLYRVTIHIRANPEMDRSIIMALINAIHNIPLYLQNGHRDFGSQVQWDIDQFDSSYAKSKAALCLREIYDKALKRFRAEQ